MGLAPMGFASQARLLLAACAVLAFAGCATPVTSSVTVFHEWPGDAPRTYRIATSEAQLDSLEHASYRHLLRAELARLGFAESRVPRFEVRLDPSVVGRAERRVEYAYPYYVQPWFQFGTWGSHGGVSMAWPWYGWGGGYGVEREFVWHEYRLSIEFRDLAANGRKVFEANAATVGDSPSIAAAMPFLVRSVLADFPGLSGVTRRVEIAPDAVAPIVAMPSAQPGAPAPAPSAPVPTPPGSAPPPAGGPPIR